MFLNCNSVGPKFPDIVGKNSNNNRQFLSLIPFPLNDILHVYFPSTHQVFISLKLNPFNFDKKKSMYPEKANKYSVMRDHFYPFYSLFSTKLSKA